MSEKFPSKLTHNSNGRVFALVGENEYVVFRSVAMRTVSFGGCLDFVWSAGKFCCAMACYVELPTLLCSSFAHNTPHHTIPYDTIPYHTTPRHTIPYHNPFPPSHPIPL